MDKNQVLLTKEKNMKIFMWGFIGLSAFTAYFSYIMGEQLGKQYYYGFILIIPFLFMSFYFRGRMLKYRALYHIKSSWGKKEDRKRNFKDIKKLYEYLCVEKSNEFFIDNQTFEDFTLDKVFEVLDRTLSTPGEQILYRMLRNPIFDEDILIRRKQIINFFQNNKDLRDKVQTELYWMGRQRKNTITEFLWGKLPPKSNLKYLFNLMAIIPVILIILIPFYGGVFGFYLVFVLIINMFIHNKFRDQISCHVDSMTYLGSLVNTAKKLGTIDDNLPSYYKDIFLDNTKNIKSSKSAAIVASVEGGDVIVEYLNILFLTKERKFYSVIDELTKFRDELRKVYIALGELDALISIASYRTGLTYYCEPVLNKKERNMDIINMYHPLIDNPVANSIKIENGGIVLTGSNMSGKSTFLRTLGINVLFAQTICTCLSESYTGSYFKILSSISPSDNLLVGKSYYLGEAEAVLRIIKACNEELPCLCIIDEIFRGTNPIERISASAEILDYLIKHNSLPIVATHDLELTEIVDSRYECYYFTEDVDDEGLKFDYLIRKGVSPTRNAIKLLKYLGYPEEVINNTNKRVDILFNK
ncbi:MutS family DNA mismatch repair protein [Clostridium sp. YIM B02515]|uniref:MutS family DNA mismatch repair protein n=1 Tax=Clostridium rhizosphaerae TaxID=2803861 RepID=A0ABS1TBR4_9CLOT|nr:MutS family DNA mismatch repair protein [Clostridium rhizosphaerae]MBL4935749.1 MutS family DNA mismatch repair protein [Clostridium rhizosphaerae]